uniref:Uncharacterized protein n=1 Tax=Cyprinus carpio TaxID=7962 RepID=A0A8C1NNE7_CYPCA
MSVVFMGCGCIWLSVTALTILLLSTAPNLKGRPRKKKLSISQRRDSQGQGGTARETNGVEGKSLAKIKSDSKSGVSKPRNNSNSCKKDNLKVETGEECRTDEQAFLVALYKYMKERKTPIERIPYLGFKQSKYSFFTSSSITKLWKSQALHKSTT